MADNVEEEVVDARRCKRCSSSVRVATTVKAYASSRAYARETHDAQRTHAGLRAHGLGTVGRVPMHT